MFEVRTGELGSRAICRLGRAPDGSDGAVLDVVLEKAFGEDGLRKRGKRERCRRRFWMGGMREDFLDKTCNVFWEMFRDRGENVLHSEKFAFLRRVGPEKRSGNAYINLFVIFCFEGSEPKELGDCFANEIHVGAFSIHSSKSMW